MALQILKPAFSSRPKMKTEDRNRDRSHFMCQGIAKIAKTKEENKFYSK